MTMGILAKAPNSEPMNWPFQLNKIEFVALSTEPVLCNDVDFTKAKISENC